MSSNLSAMCPHDPVLAAKLQQIRDRVRHCQHTLSSATSVLPSVKERLIDLLRERPEARDEENYHVWVGTVLKLDQEANDVTARIYGMSEELEHLSKELMDLEVLLLLDEASGANGSRRTRG